MKNRTPKPAPAATWLADSAMNLLVDYYPEIQFRPYGSGATRRNVVPFLKQLEISFVLGANHLQLQTV